MCGSDRAVNIPSLSSTLQQIVDAMQRVAARKGITPGAVRFELDAFLSGIVGSMAGATDFARATALGIAENPTLDDMVLQYLDDFGVAGSGLYKG